jgi:predicted DNA-binding transcriptional regulator AlpA
MTEAAVSSELLTTVDLAHRWHTTEQAIYAARYRGECPRAVRVGRRLLFRLADVISWEEHRVEEPRR